MTSADAFWIPVLAGRLAASHALYELANRMRSSLAHRIADRAAEDLRPQRAHLERLLPAAPPWPLTRAARKAWKPAVLALVPNEGPIAAVARRCGEVAEVAITQTALAHMLNEGDVVRDELAFAALVGAEAVTALTAASLQARAALTPEQVSPAVAIALGELEAVLAVLPDAAVVGHARGLEAWGNRFDECCRRIAVALALPAEPAELAPPSAEERALFAQVPERPMDLALRARCAELAVARRDPRGWLIHEQLRAGGSGDASAIAALIARHPAWTAAVVDLGATAVRLARGFVEEIAIELAVLVEVAPALLAVAPIRSIRITGSSTGIAALADATWLARIVALDLSSTGLTDDDLAVLLRSRHLDALVVLDLSHNPLTDRALELLAAAALPALACCPRQGTHCSALYTQEWSLQELPTLEDLPTPQLVALQQRFGPRRWYADIERPSLDRL